MDKIVIASIREGAGKTSIAVGLAETLGKKIGYMKPFGDRSVYKKKKLWDYDVALMTKVYELKDNPEDMCFGFDHSKLSYLHDDKDMRNKLLEAVKSVKVGKELLLIEGGRDLVHGTYIHLGPLSIAKHTGSKLIVVVSGNSDSIIDDVAFIKKYIDQTKINLNGIIINKVKDIKDFKKSQLPQIKEIGVPILGVIPYLDELTHFSVAYLVDALTAKVITGEKNLNTIIGDILVGAMSVDVPLQKIFSQNQNILMITSGDRTDMILAALDRDTKAIVLTNDILPPSNIISKAEDKGIPMLLVSSDTYTTAKAIDEMVALIEPSEKHKIKLLGKTVRAELDLKTILNSRP